jgi:hypothetical protein
LGEVAMVLSEMKRLPVQFKEYSALKTLFLKLENVQERAQSFAAKEEGIDWQQVDIVSLLKEVEEYGVIIPEIQKLQEVNIQTTLT